MGDIGVETQQESVYPSEKYWSILSGSSTIIWSKTLILENTQHLSLSSKQKLVLFKYSTIHIGLNRYRLSITETSYLDKLNMLRSFILEELRYKSVHALGFIFFFFNLTHMDQFFLSRLCRHTTVFAIRPKMCYCISGTYV